jgi:RNA polymerase II-associated factor 1
MPTSVETKQSKKAGDKRSSSSRSVDLLCSVKYKNNLPDVPFGPKFLSYPFDSQRYIQYNPTSLERNHNHELLTEVDLGIPIDLVLPETYENNDPSASLDPTDAALLEEEVLQQPESKRAKQHARNVSWLRRTEYISTEYSRPHSSMEGAENKVGYSVKKRLQSMDTYKVYFMLYSQERIVFQCLSSCRTEPVRLQPSRLRLRQPNSLSPNTTVNLE